MDTYVNCSCGQNILVNSDAEGQQFPCPSCGKRLIVPKEKDVPFTVYEKASLDVLQSVGFVKRDLPDEILKTLPAEPLRFLREHHPHFMTLRGLQRTMHYEIYIPPQPARERPSAIPDERASKRSRPKKTAQEAVPFDSYFKASLTTLQEAGLVKRGIPEEILKTLPRAPLKVLLSKHSRFVTFKGIQRAIAYENYAEGGKRKEVLYAPVPPAVKRRARPKPKAKPKIEEEDEFQKDEFEAEPQPAVYHPLKSDYYCPRCGRLEINGYYQKEVPNQPTGFMAAHWANNPMLPMVAMPMYINRTRHATFCKKCGEEVRYSG